MNLRAMWRLAPLLLVLVCTACAPALVTSEPITSVPLAGTPGAESPTLPPGVTASPASDVPLAALVNGRPIYLADYERALGQYEAKLPNRLRKANKFLPAVGEQPRHLDCESTSDFQRQRRFKPLISSEYHNSTDR